MGSEIVVPVAPRAEGSRLRNSYGHEPERGHQMTDRVRQCNGNMLRKESNEGRNVGKERRNNG
jgi:hypothetical protein